MGALLVGMAVPAAGALCLFVLALIILLSLPIETDEEDRDA